MHTAKRYFTEFSSSKDLINLLLMLNAKELNLHKGCKKQGPQKLSSLKSLKIRECAMKPSEMFSLSNSMQNREERQKQSKHNIYRRKS